MQNRNNELGKLIRSAREQLGISQAELSHRLVNKSGLELGNTTIAKIETGTRGLGVLEAAAISEALGIPWSTFQNVNAPIREEERLKGAVKAGKDFLYREILEALNTVPALKTNLAELLVKSPEKRPRAEQLSELLERIEKLLLESATSTSEFGTALFNEKPVTYEYYSGIWETPSVLSEIEKRKNSSNGEG